jgi:hypothetical protein
MQNRLLKRIGIGIGIAIAGCAIYVLGYFNGAKCQAQNNRPYTKIIDTTGQTHVILK